MKVLVTGGAGFIGSWVVDGYIEAGYEVVVVDDLSTGRLENLNPKVRFYLCDIVGRKDRKIIAMDTKRKSRKIIAENADIKKGFKDSRVQGVGQQIPTTKSQTAKVWRLEEVFEAEQPEIVNHHAAQASVRKSLEQPGFDLEVNLLGSLNLLELCRHYGVKGFIYASSGGAVYGEPRYLPCDEAHPISPLSPYGISKHTVEHYIELYGLLYGLPYIILRYPNVYGERQDPYGEAGVVAIFARQMLNDEEVLINGDGNQERDFVYVADIVEANLLALAEVHSSQHLFNLGSGKGTSVNRLFQMLSRLTGYRRKPKYGPPIPGEVYKIHLDARKAEENLGWRPKTGLKEGLREVIKGLRSKD